jgi:hypothetical protein
MHVPHDRILKILKGLSVFLYLGVIFLWFRGNFAPLRDADVSSLIPLVPLIGILAARIVLAVRDKGIRLRPRLTRGGLALFAVLLLAFALRLPFLLHGTGMMTSDDAIPALMGKHIAEGKLPPVYYYGQQYIGSLPSHVFALLFKCLGYSITLFKLATLFFYLGFIAVQFFLIRELFSPDFAFLTGVFYALPVGSLVNVGFDNTGHYALVLFLGSSVIYLAYLAAFKKKELFLCPLGFLIGLSFWTHQITAAFIVTALVMVAVFGKVRLPKFLAMGFYAAVGCFPLLLSEIFNRFQIVGYLTGGEKRPWSGPKLKETGNLMGSLFFPESRPLGLLALALSLAGLGMLIIRACRKRERLCQAHWALFLILFGLMYALSRFSDRPVGRYLWPLYFCLPVFFLYVLYRVSPPKLRSFSVLALIGFVLAFNVKGRYEEWRSVRDGHTRTGRVMAALDETGDRFWLADYWTSYLITAISGEKVICASTTTSRYYPYRLQYYNPYRGDRFIFLRGSGSQERDYAENLVRMLSSLAIPFKKTEAGDAWLIHDIGSPVYPHALREPVPAAIPVLSLEQARFENGYLEVTFKNSERSDPSEFRLVTEIMGYSAGTRRFSGLDEHVTLTLPVPSDRPYEVDCRVLYEELVIPSSAQRLSFPRERVPLSRRKDEVVFLSGISVPVRFQDRRARFCEKEPKFEVRSPGGKKTTVRLVLHSPFDFSAPNWYGEYAQGVRVVGNGRLLLEQDLKDGRNEIEFEVKNSPPGGDADLIELSFRYHSVFDFAYNRKLAVFLESVTLEPNRSFKKSLD